MMNDYVESASNDRTVNNAVRHKYRVLSDDEKAKMLEVKDKGLEFLNLIDSLRTPPEPYNNETDNLLSYGVVCTFDRELNIAAEKVEEAVMWATKHITA